MKKQIHFSMLLTILFAFQSTHTDEITAFHHQLNHEILKNVQIEDPSKDDQDLINISRAFQDFGSTLIPMTSENWNAFLSVDMLGVLSQYNRTQTRFGYRMLQQQCSAGMTDDLTTLHEHQARIQFLHEHPELVQTLSKILGQVDDAEKKFLNLFKETETSARNLYFTSDTFKRYNENPKIIGTSARLESTLPIVLHILDWMAVPIVSNYMHDTSSNSRPYKAANALYTSIINIHKTPQTTVQVYENIFRWNHNFAVGATAVLTALKVHAVYQCLFRTKELFDMIHTKQQDLISCGHLMKALQAVKICIESDEHLKQILETEHAKLCELFDPNNSNTSTDLKDLVEKLLSSSFQGDASYLLSKQGKILATHHLLNRIKGELIPYLEAFGQVDAYLSTVKLYEEYKHHPNATFCLPEYIDSTKPMFIAQDFWHPFIDANVVVCNNLSMGSTPSNANLIITGPNAGGKTTSLTALIINIIFAQTLGIAPCKTLQITPFAKIHSSLDITTNLQEGLSLFAAEVDRAKKLKNSITSCTPGQKTFTIIDELFTGTAEAVASKIGFQFASILGEMKHSMMIITTHIAHLTNLATETPNFENYKVADAIFGQDGAITYPFKLIKGKSTQNIAEEMMKHQGIL